MHHMPCMMVAYGILAYECIPYVIHNHAEQLQHGSSLLHCMGSHEGLPNMAHTNGIHTCDRCNRPPLSPLCPASLLHPHRCQRWGGSIAAYLRLACWATADRIRRRCEMNCDQRPATTQQVNVYRRGTQMKAFACAMAHAKARGQWGWQTGPPLLRTLPNFKATSSTAEVFQ